MSATRSRCRTGFRFGRGRCARRNLNNTLALGWFGFEAAARSKSMFEGLAGCDWSGALEHVSTALSLKRRNVSPHPLTAQSEQQEHRIISPFQGPLLNHHRFSSALLSQSYKGTSSTIIRSIRFAIDSSLIFFHRDYLTRTATWRPLPLLRRLPLPRLRLFTLRAMSVSIASHRRSSGSCSSVVFNSTLSALVGAISDIPCAICR